MRESVCVLTLYLEGADGEVEVTPRADDVRNEVSERTDGRRGRIGN